MSRLAIVEPKTLLGETVRDALAKEAGAWEQIELFTAQSEDVGSVTEVVGRAALVQALTADALHGFDAVLHCGPEIDSEDLAALAHGSRIVVLDAAAPTDGYLPVVAGINDDRPAELDRLRCPAPALILLAHLLAPLRPFAPLRVAAHIVQPASVQGQAGLDELFSQTRAILSMTQEPPHEVFPTQLAFNLLPWPDPAGPLARELEAILGSQVEAALQISQAGIFHCCTVGLFLSGPTLPGGNECADLWLDQPLIERATEPELLGPVAAATSDKILLGEIQDDAGKGLWIRACADNLTLTAMNALALARG